MSLFVLTNQEPSQHSNCLLNGSNAANFSHLISIERRCLLISNAITTNLTMKLLNKQTTLEVTFIEKLCC